MPHRETSKCTKFVVGPANVSAPSRFHQMEVRCMFSATLESKDLSAKVVNSAAPAARLGEEPTACIACLSNWHLHTALRRQMTSAICPTNTSLHCSTTHVRRFGHGLIYTSAGTVLISLNPKVPLPQEYGEIVMHDYDVAWCVARRDDHTCIPWARLPSHLSCVMAPAPMVVSGESGAGKTGVQAPASLPVMGGGTKPHQLPMMTLGWRVVCCTRRPSLRRSTMRQPRATVTRRGSASTTWS